MLASAYPPGMWLRSKKWLCNNLWCPPAPTHPKAD